MLVLVKYGYQTKGLGPFIYFKRGLHGRVKKIRDEVNKCFKEYGETPRDLLFIGTLMPEILARIVFPAKSATADFRNKDVVRNLARFMSKLMIRKFG